MKLSDMQGGQNARKSHGKINEGFWSEFGDNLLTSFAPGSNAADNAAIRKAKRGGERQARMTYEIGLNNLTKTLNDALSSALQAGLIGPGPSPVVPAKDPGNQAFATMSDQLAGPADANQQGRNAFSQMASQLTPAADAPDAPTPSPDSSNTKAAIDALNQRDQWAKKAAAAQSGRKTGGQLVPVGRAQDTPSRGGEIVPASVSDMEVGQRTSTGGDQFTTPTGRIHKAGRGREEMQAASRAKSGTRRAPSAPALPAPKSSNLPAVREMTYRRFESLLESLITEDDPEQQQAQQITIADYIARYVNNIAAQEKIDIAQVDPGFRRLKQLSEIIASKIGNATVVQLSTNDYKPLWDLYVAAAKLQAAAPGLDSQEPAPKKDPDDKEQQKQSADAGQSADTGILSALGIDPTADKGKKARSASAIISKLVKALKSDDALIADKLKKAIDNANI